MVDFRQIVLDDRKLTIQEGIVYHYWQDNSKEYDWTSVFFVYIGDVLTAMSSPFLFVTIPTQYLIEL